jgi:hypothetical protein
MSWRRERQKKEIKTFGGGTAETCQTKTKLQLRSQSRATPSSLQGKQKEKEDTEKSGRSYCFAFHPQERTHPAARSVTYTESWQANSLSPKRLQMGSPLKGAALVLDSEHMRERFANSVYPVFKRTQMSNISRLR